MTKYENGVHSISNNDYHASEGISRSQLLTLSRTPAHYHHKYLNPNYVQPPTPTAFLLGSLVHTMVLEPLLIHNEYAVYPEGTDRRTKAGKEQYEYFISSNQGKEIVSPDMYYQANAMRDSVWNDDTAKALVTDAEIEKSIYFQDTNTKIQMKARPDLMLGSMGIDLKTTVDGSPRAFQNSASSYGYYHQAAFCHKAMASIGIEMESFIFICVEKTAPYCVSIHELDAEAIGYGIEMVDDLMLQLKSCIDTDRWPSYPLQTLTVPGYAK